MILYREIGWSQYEPREQDADLFQRICDQGKLPELEDYLVASSGSEYVNERDVDDLLWHEEPFVIKLLGLDMSDDEGDEDDEVLTLGQWVFKRADCPKNATCAAVDANGDAWWYTCDPEKVKIDGPNATEWYSDSHEQDFNLNFKLIESYFDASDWRNSKITREEKK